MRTLFSFLFLLSFSVIGLSQMVIGTDTLYGNEWIDFDKDYYKIKVSEDGVYRVSQASLVAAGVPVGSIEGNKFSVHHLGQEYPIYVSTDGLMQSNDFIEFVGRKNRTDLDQHLYAGGKDDLLNTEYSLFNDTSAYFLSWDNANAGHQFNQETFTGSNLTPQNYLLKEDALNFSNYRLKNVNGVGVKYSHFEKGEGFAGNLLITQSFTLNPELPSTFGVTPSLEIRYGSNANTHNAILSINGVAEATENFVGYTVKSFSVDLTKSQIQSPVEVQLDGNFITFIDGSPVNNDRYSVSEVNLRYPRQTNIEDKQSFSFLVEASGDEKYYEISSSGNELPVIYDVENNERITPNRQGDQFQFLVSPGAERRIDIIFSSAVRAVTTDEKVNFIDYTLINPEFLIISSKKLQVDPLSNGVQRYNDHRKNKYNSEIVNVEDLYNQFGYGVDRHSICLRNFSNYALKGWSDLEFALILGKGINYEYYRTGEQIENLEHIFFVPTYGSPGSDNLIFSKGFTPHTNVVTGRLASINEQQIDEYLDKIKLHEAHASNPQTIEGKAWMKKIIHMSGGDSDLQPLLANILGNMEHELETNKFGANVTTFYKSSGSVLQDLKSDDVLDIIHDGTAMITFFGHSSTGTFDFSIADPDKWNNEGKNPVMVSLGCHSGNIHNLNTFGLSEKYVLEPKNGAIGFLASSSTAYVTPQAQQGLDTYARMGNEDYGKSIGNAYTSIRQQYSDNTTIDYRTLVQQMTYHGDPSILMYPEEAQDYIFDYSTAKTNPKFVSSADEKFEFSIDLVNLGTNEKDTVDLQFVYQLPDGTVSDTVNVSFYDTLQRHTVTVEFDVQGLKSLGENFVFGEIDYNNKIEELPNPAAENNNSIKSSATSEGFNFYILDNTARPFSPCNYGVITDTDYSLRAATSNASAPVQTFVVELDTTINFNSPSVEKTRITQGGGVIEWKPNTSLENETVYYWRISPDSTSAENTFIWQGASFTYRANAEDGWNQQHFQQFEQDDLDGLGFDEDQNMEFVITGRPVEIINAIWDQPTVGTIVNNSGLSGSQRPWRVLGIGGVAFGVVDPLTGKFWINNGGDFGSVNNSNFGTKRAFAFPTNTKEERDKVINFVENVVPDDHYITFYTLVVNLSTDFHPEEWAQDSIVSGTNIFQTFEKYGAMQIRQLEQKGSVPYLYIFKKSTGFETEAIANLKTDYISGRIITNFISDDGYLTTNKIGPALEWNKVQWANNINTGVDSTSLSIHVYDKNDVLDTSYVYQSPQGDIDISFLDTMAEATIKLEYYNIDAADRTSPNLDYLRVLYKPYPDLAIDLQEHYVFHSDSIQRGDDLDISFAIQSDFSETIDSVAVKYSIFTEQNELIETINKTAPIGVDGIVHSNFSKNTRDLVGKNQMNIEVNYNESPVEKFRFNNIFIREFTVFEDNENPILDITFDGIHILDGDLISAKPFIRISAKDENPFLKMVDEKSFEIFLEDPNGQEIELLSSDPRVQFYPADDELTAYIEYTPEYVVEGNYEIRVQARDATGNYSADNELIKTFKIILEEQVSNIINYPNPFSTSTQFVFTLTGTEVPENITIRIMTLSGKVVKEITKDELGPLRIGLNRTEFKWNGTDEYGSKLANGVYLYKAFISDTNGENYKHLENESVDGFFQKGFGKLVIMR